MKKCLSLFLFCLLFSLPIFSQIGFTVAPTQGRASEWQVLTENYITHRKAEFLQYGVTGVIDYTFELSAPEWQIAPAIHAMRSHYIFKDHDFEVFAVGVQSNFNFTPFKAAQGREFRNMRLYFQLSPAVDFVRMQYRLWNREDEAPLVLSKLDDQKLALNGGLHFLMDVRLSELLKISPMVGLRYYPNLEWSGFTKTVSNGDFKKEYDRVDWRHLLFGLRVGWSLKEK